QNFPAKYLLTNKKQNKCQNKLVFT
ncbi:hypothetical protein AVEN_189809-1, partial [Araneus ventricosus]